MKPDTQKTAQSPSLLTVWTGDTLTSILRVWFLMTLTTVGFNLWSKNVTITLAVISAVSVMVAIGITLYLVNNGRPKTGIAIMATIVTLSLMRSLLLRGGLILPVSYAFMTLILLVGFVAGKRWGVFFAGLTAIMFTLIFFGQRAELIYELKTIDRSQVYLFLMGRLVVTSAFTYYAARAIEQAFHEVQHRQLALEKRTAELEQRNTQLRASEHDNAQIRHALEKSNHAFELSNKELQESLHEKEILLREVHHRVKNNLQIVNSLMRMSERRFSDEPLIQSELQDLQCRVRSMSYIHEQLYQEDDFSQIDMAIYVRALVTDISKTYIGRHKNITLDLMLASVKLPLDMALPVGLVINELLTNAIKHGYPPEHLAQLAQIEKGGVIRCEIAVDEERTDENLMPVTLIVANDGIPFDVERTMQSKTMGMQLINLLVRQLGGVLTATSTEEISRFVLTFQTEYTLK